MPAQTIDEYMADLPDDQRGALERLRELIRAAAPEAVETISYGRPAFKLGGRYFVGFGVTQNRVLLLHGPGPGRRARR